MSWHRKQSTDIAAVPSPRCLANNESNLRFALNDISAWWHLCLNLLIFQRRFDDAIAFVSSAVEQEPQHPSFSRSHTPHLATCIG